MKIIVPSYCVGPLLALVVLGLFILIYFKGWNFDKKKKKK